MYNGDTKNNKKNGKGCMHFVNGDVYIGMWGDDFP
jgi:hypothetical protein